MRCFPPYCSNFCATGIAFLGPQGWLLPGQNPINPMTTRQLTRACHTAAQMAAITKRVTPHSLRHYGESRIMPSCLWIAVAACALSPPYSA